MGRLYLGNQEITPILYDKGSFAGIPKGVSNQGVYEYPAQSFSFSLPSTATDLGRQALYYSFIECPTLSSADLSSLTAISGYHAMLERVEPSAIICLGNPFAEMQGNIISVDYLDSRKVVR